MKSYSQSMVLGVCINVSQKL